MTILKYASRLAFFHPPYEAVDDLTGKDSRLLAAFVDYILRVVVQFVCGELYRGRYRGLNLLAIPGFALVGLYEDVAGSLDVARYDLGLDALRGIYFDIGSVGVVLRDQLAVLVLGIGVTHVACACILAGGRCCRGELSGIFEVTGGNLLVEVSPADRLRNVVIADGLLDAQLDILGYRAEFDRTGQRVVDVLVRVDVLYGVGIAPCVFACGQGYLGSVGDLADERLECRIDSRGDILALGVRDLLHRSLAENVDYRNTCGQFAAERHGDLSEYIGIDRRSNLGRVSAFVDDW